MLNESKMLEDELKNIESKLKELKKSKINFEKTHQLKKK